MKKYNQTFITWDFSDRNVSTRFRRHNKLPAFCEQVRIQTDDHGPSKEILLAIWFDRSESPLPEYDPRELVRICGGKSRDARWLSRAGDCSFTSIGFELRPSESFCDTAIEIAKPVFEYLGIRGHTPDFQVTLKTHVAVGRSWESFNLHLARKHGLRI